MATTEISTASTSGFDPRHRRPTTGGVETEPVPVLLLELQDKLSRSRVREAFWISVMVHLLAIIAIATMPHWVPGGYKVTLITPSEMFKNQEQTFLALPPDLQKPAEKPKTNIISDKDHIATTRHPEPNRKELQKIIDAARPGPPAPPAQQMASSAPPSPPPQMGGGQQPNQGAQQLGAGGQQFPQTNQMAKLESLPPGGSTRTGNNPFAAAMSAGSAIEQAARATANSRGMGGGAGGDYGIGPRSNANVQSGLEVLSDTQGVDFGPYLERVVFKVKQNWYLVIPDSVRAPIYKRGKVTIDFAIQKDGRVAGMRVMSTSGDVYLDRAAWSGITASDPFPPLPSQFTGGYLALRFHFLYNPNEHDLQ
ncbi:MAG: TonB family protein [Terriglobales bacterium]